LYSCIPPTPSSSRIATDNTIILIPQKTQFVDDKKVCCVIIYLILEFTVPPVVVNPDADSNTAWVNDKSNPGNVI
jgi:hypothetical protein